MKQEMQFRFNVCPIAIGNASENIPGNRDWLFFCEKSVCPISKSKMNARLISPSFLKGLYKNGLIYCVLK
jgi:hypothetical protein